MSMSLLDADQVTKSVYDEVDQALRVNVVAQTAANSTVELLDGVGGVNKAQISAANALKVDGSAVTQPVSGNVTVTGSGNFTVVQPTGTNLHTVVDSGTINSKATTPTALTVTQAAITVGTSAVRLTVSGSAPASTRVLLAATPDSLSTATFYIGSASVTNSGATRGFQIVGGQPFVANNDAGDYYIVSSVAGQTVFLIEQS